MSQSDATHGFDPVTKVGRLPPTDVAITVHPKRGTPTDWVLPGRRLVWVIRSSP
jgi:hypothetical protein